MKKKICLNMIVRNESKVILRCLESVCPLIDHWVIVDTGSKDDTPELIENFFKEKKIAGELHKRKWINFEKNRNQALNLAKGHGDYFLFIDADEQFIYQKDFKLPPLEKDCYLIQCDNDSILNYRKLLVRAELNWKWVGALHETIECKEEKTFDLLPGILNFVSGGGGARSIKPRKTRENDAKILEKILKKEPKNSRALFYLGLTYLLLQKFDLALDMFKKRAKDCDFSEEQYLSLLHIAKIKDGLKEKPDNVFKAYLEAIKIRPERQESYFYLARFLRKQKDLRTAFEVAKKGMEFTETKDLLSVESKIYHFGLPLEYSVIAVGLGEIEKGKEVALALLDKPNLPETVRSFICSMWKK